MKQNHFNEYIDGSTLCVQFSLPEIIQMNENASFVEKFDQGKLYDIIQQWLKFSHYTECVQ